MRNWMLTVITVLAVANLARCEEPSYKLQVKVYEYSQDNSTAKAKPKLLMNTEQIVKANQDVKANFEEEVDDITHAVTTVGFTSSIRLGKLQDGKIEVTFSPSLCTPFKADLPSELVGSKIVTAYDVQAASHKLEVPLDQITKLFNDGDELKVRNTDGTSRYWKVAVKVSKAESK